LIRSGRLGRLLEIRTRGKEDNRGGGEDLWVLGCHMFNLMCYFGGNPQWCFGTVEQDSRPVRAGDVRPGSEGIGPLAGDAVHACYRLDGGVIGHFDSVRGAGGRVHRFGIQIIGSEGLVQSFDTGPLPAMFFLPDPTWNPGRTGKKWLPVSSQGVDRPEPLKNPGLHGGNLLAVKDLIDAIERDRPPLCSIEDARRAIEMVVCVFESHRQGCPVRLPLANRQNPLTMLK
jgi:predicted dehydrogenase